MGGFSLSPTVFKCFSTKAKKRASSRRVSESTNSSSCSTAYLPANSDVASVGSSSSSLSSSTSSSSQRELLGGQECQKRRSKKTYNTSAFKGPKCFSKGSGYSQNDFNALQVYRFAGRWKSSFLKLRRDEIAFIVVKTKIHCYMRNCWQIYWPLCTVSALHSKCEQVEGWRSGNKFGWRSIDEWRVDYWSRTMWIFPQQISVNSKLLVRLL